MHIINAFLRLTSLGGHRVKSCFGSSSTSAQQQDDESTPLLRQAPSLTSEYHGFEHSASAFWTVFFHAMIYYSLAVFGFCWFVEDFTLVDSMYFATVLFTTIGYGDMAPTTDRSRTYTMFLAMYGIIILGIFIGIAGEWVVQMREDALSKKRKTKASQVVQQLQQDVTTGASSTGNTTATSAAAAQQLEDEGNGHNNTEQNGDNTAQDEKPMWKDILSIARLEFPIVAILIVVSVVVAHVEGWSVLGGLYWLVMTGTTVGFGDYHPSTMGVRLFSCFFLPLAVAVLGEMLARIASAYMERKQDKTEHEFLNRSLTLADLARLDADHDGKVDKTEFLTYMLVALQKVDKEDIEEIHQLFHKLDADRNGFLDKFDLAEQEWDTTVKNSLRKGLSQRALLPPQSRQQQQV